MGWKDKTGLFFYVGVLIVSGIALLSSGCKNSQTKEAGSAPTVEVAEVLVRDIPVYSEWTASTDGLVNATIRAQVQGYLIEQNYKEGDFVKKGQVLFKIDPRTFQAALEQAKGQLAQQQARWEIAKANLERIKPLVKLKAISLKDLDDAVGTEQAALASVAAAQAVVDKAQVDLGFTKITSPIAGIAGIAKAQLGNLVGIGSIEELTTVSTVDPIKVYVSMSEQEYLEYVQYNGGHGQKLPLQMILADGRIHPHKGSFAFADRQVDVRTGTIKVAALFPNPGNIIRPGQFARVIARTAIKKGALLVPQRAVTELQGGFQVAIVALDNKVSIRPVKVAERVDNLWVIETGLKPGERVVAEGVQKVREGSVVTVKPFVGASEQDTGPKNVPGTQPKEGTKSGDGLKQKDKRD
ncbi:MAG: efflux RND transporter periplasmic adaptor subunit [Proteobacteria bacterium]|nr:efflux RND transporter periplasmic adaptor subunit [Pseudomonadota bacterium]